MAKGLSKLQLSILRLAYAKRSLAFVGSHRLGRGVDVYTDELLIGCFGFQPVYPRYGEEGRFYFSQAAIGRGRYNSARVSLSRALLRLTERGLGVQHWGIAKWSGFTLSEAGVQVVESEAQCENDARLARS